jgi:acetyl-CoA acetyltransferase
MSHELRDRCAIVGIGNTAYTRGSDRSVTELHLEASLLALNDAGLRPSDVDGIVPSSVAERVVEDFTRNLGIKDLGFSSTPHAGGSSYVMGIQEACMAVHAGVAECVLLPAGRLGYSSMQRASRVAEHPNPALTDMVEFEFPLGNVGPAMWFAQQARRHMHLYGTTSEQLGRMAVTIRRHANLNPQALMYARTLTLEDHQASRMIVDPFRLFDCSLETDGAGAIVVTSADRAKDLRQPPVLITGVGSAYGYPGTSVTQAEEPSELRGIGHAGRRAFAMAGMGPQDIDVVAVHEGFSFFVIACLEALGFCSVGEGGPLVASEDIALGGRLPLNTHGGALSEAHVSGANHVIEIVRQLRRSVEQPRQVEGCQIGLVANEGNFDNGAVVILKKP